mmetsp:Transcript_9827/g.14648  ORF Transcript_9827/g.14648 Transcript_9827/m.14648 type:complete len:103 (+) Transcript_9827:131-439(+)
MLRKMICISENTSFFIKGRGNAFDFNVFLYLLGSMDILHLKLFFRVKKCFTLLFVADIHTISLDFIIFDCVKTYSTVRNNLTTHSKMHHINDFDLCLIHRLK